MLRQSLSIACLSFVLVSSARADELDGDWCNALDGEITIVGSTVLTPFGYLVRGSHTPHRFEYVAPAGDWYAGRLILMQQLDERLMELSVDGAPDGDWKPCEPEEEGDGDTEEPEQGASD